MVDDQDALDVAQLVADYHQAVYRYAYRLTGNVPDAEDLTQQVFLRAQQRLAQVRCTASVRSWLFTILRNLFLKNCEKRHPVLAGSVNLDIETIPDRSDNDPGIDQERLQAAIDDLAPGYRVVLLMFYYEDCSYREIAERLNLPIGTVMSRLARAKGHLRSQLFELERHGVPDAQVSAASQCG